MAGRIRHEDIQAVREKADIVKVVSGYLQLKKAGRDSMVGICPFHTEKTPSLSVSPAKQVYYCFGCGEAGDVFRFLEKVETLSFTEAVERLAREAGVSLRYESQTVAGRRAEGRRQVMYRAISEAARLYAGMLRESREGSEARDYLATRGLSVASAERFGIGYAPGYPDYLLKRMSKTYSSDLLLEVGLVAKDARGVVRDRFRGRVTFPIHDLSGNAVGFGARLLEGPRAPTNVAKYVNSPDSPVYHKGTLLYNLNRAKAEITATGRAFLVEGYTDVIALDQAGLRTAVATCGTALGEEHIRLLARFGQRIVLAFDSDEAGARAAERAFQFHQDYPVDISVMILPQGQDPADFVLANEDAGPAFSELAERAVPLVEYMIGRSLIGRDLTDLEERARAVRAGLAYVIALEDPVRRQEYARVLAGMVGEPELSVMLQLDRMTAPAGPAAAPPTRSDQPHRGRIPPDEEVELEALKLLVQEPGLSAGRLASVGADRFHKPTHRRAFQLLREAWGGASSDTRAAWVEADLRSEGMDTGSGRPDGGGGRNGADDVEQVSNQGTGTTVSSLVSLAQSLPSGEQLGRLMGILALEPPRSGGPPTREYAERVFLRLEEFALKREADEVRKELQRLNPLKAPADHEALFERLVALEGTRRRLRAEAEAIGSTP